jgi:hypothetical protein
MQARMIANANAPRTLNTGFMGQRGAINPSDFNLITNPDGTVTLYHGTTNEAAKKIIQDKKLLSAGEPDVYMTTDPMAGYGDGTVVQLNIDPKHLFLDDEFPSGRVDFRMPSVKGWRIQQPKIYAPKTLNAGFMGQRGSVGTQRPLTEFEQAHLIAQQNAALPVSQGGLGLAPDNTAMDRARALGFDVDVYHGTGKDIGQFDLKIAADKEGRSRGLGLGRGKIYTSNEDVASSYAMAAPIRKLGKESNVLPLKTSGKFLPEEDYYEMFEQLAGKPSYSSDLDMKTRDAIIKKLDDKLKKEGYAGIRKLHYNEDGSIAEVGQTAIFDPKNIRSRFAAFDPMKKESSNLLATSAVCPTSAILPSSL